MVPTTLASRKISNGCRWTSTAPLVNFSVAVAMVVPSLVDRDEASCSLPRASCLVAGDEALAVEHCGHDPPAESVDEEEGGSEEDVITPSPNRGPPTKGGESLAKTPPGWKRLPPLARRRWAIQTKTAHPA